MREYLNKDVLADPFYVKHPFLYNPFDKFGLHKVVPPTDKVSITDMPTLLNILNSLGSVFLDIFALLPSADQGNDTKGTV